MQASLLDELLPGTTARLGPLAGRIERTWLADGAWVDVRPGWVSGSDQLFDALMDSVAWRAEERPMYDRVVAVPRLLAWFGEGQAWPDALLTQARDALDAHYELAPAERFVSAGLCLYRDGRDSVAWHGDRIGRSRHEDVMVAILSIGEPRALHLRPRARGDGRDGGRGGAATVRHLLGHGDLLVMGGSCQRTWDHAVPKTARQVGPRISIQFRPQGVA